MLLAGAHRADAAVAPHTLQAIQAELDQQRVIWQYTRLVDYSYQMQRLKNAPGLVVVNDQTIDRVEDEAGLPLDPKDYLTIDELFDVVQGAIDTDALAIVVNYDAERGFPVLIVVTYSLGDVDAYTAVSFTAGTERAQT